MCGRMSRLKWFFSPNRHVVSIINKARKQKRIGKKDITTLDEKSNLIPQEISEAESVVEDPTVQHLRENGWERV